MFGQTFQISDLASVGALVFLEALLSADNALVLAIMVKHLPREEQKKALLYGLGGAFVFRLIAILFAAVVLKQWWLQMIGGLYLLYLPAKHFIKAAKEKDGSAAKSVNGGFWQTVIAVELTDIAFALDSVLAGIGFITRPGQGVMNEKIWVVYFGAIIGIVLLRFAAGLFVRLLEKYPTLDHVAYLLVGWVGVKLAFHAAAKFQEVNPNALPFSIPHLPEAIFWGGLGLIAIGGGILAYMNRREDHELDDEAARLEAAQDMVITPEESARADEIERRQE